MHKSASQLISVGLVLLMAFALIPAAASAEKIMYVSGDPNELGVTTFNPIKVELSHDAMWVIYDRFVEMGLDNKFYPGLAESWVISSDGLIWKMKLKKGDQVIITIGKDKGRKGKIEKVFLKTNRVLIPGINVYKRHLKPRGEKQQVGI